MPGPGSAAAADPAPARCQPPPSRRPRPRSRDIASRRCRGARHRSARPRRPARHQTGRPTFTPSSRPRSTSSTSRTSDLFYGKAPGAARHQHEDPGREGHRPDRPVRLRQVHAPAQLQPPQRPDRQRPHRGNDPLPRSADSRPERRRDRAPQADGNGLPEVQSVPDVDLRERRLRPADRRREARAASWTKSASDRSAARPCGTK